MIRLLSLIATFEGGVTRDSVAAFSFDSKDALVFPGPAACINFLRIVAARVYACDRDPEPPLAVFEAVDMPDNVVELLPYVVGVRLPHDVAFFMPHVSP